jgi:hypothetical protein
VVHVNSAVEWGTGVARFFADGPGPIVVVATIITAVLSSGPILIVVFIARHEHDLLQRKACRIRLLVYRAGMTLATFTAKAGGWPRDVTTSQKIWDPAIGKEIVTLRGNTNWVFPVAFVVRVRLPRQWQA